MSVSLLGLLAALALADSLNPFTIAAQAYLLSTPRPFPRSLAFLGGTALTYFAGGMLLLSGWSAVRAALLPLVPVWGWGAAEIVLALALGGFAWWSWARGAAGKPLALPGALGIPAAFAFAFASTLSDLPTAIPLFAAADRVAAAGLAFPAQALLVAFYVCLYVLPLVALLVARAALADRSDRLFGTLQAAVDWSFRNLLPPATALVAAYLLFDGCSRLAGQHAL